MVITFPKPLPPLQIETIEDDFTQLTNPEKVALRNTRRCLTMSNFRQHALQLHLDFYTENEDLINLFRNPSGKLDLERMYNHQKHLLGVYLQIIKEGLDDINRLLSQVVKQHQKYRVSSQHIRLQTKALNDYVRHTLSSQMSPTLRSALDKLKRIIDDYHALEEQTE